MNKEEIQDILEELHLVRPEILQPKAKKLFEAIMSIADERDNLLEENKELHNKIDEISDFIKENKIKRYRVIESEDYDEEIVLDEDDITCLERIINDEYDYENR